MQCIKDIGKIVGVIGGLDLLLAGTNYLMGGISNSNTIEYQLYEYEMAKDEAEQELRNESK